MLGSFGCLDQIFMQVVCMMVLSTVWVFSWFGAGHDAALDHKGAAGSSLHEMNAFW